MKILTFVFDLRNRNKIETAVQIFQRSLIKGSTLMACCRHTCRSVVGPSLICVGIFEIFIATTAAPQSALSLSSRYPSFWRSMLCCIQQLHGEVSFLYYYDKTKRRRNYQLPHESPLAIQQLLHYFIWSGGGSCSVSQSVTRTSTLILLLLQLTHHRRPQNILGLLQRQCLIAWLHTV